MKSFFLRIILLGVVFFPQMVFGAEEVPGVRDLLMSFLKWLLGISAIIAVISFVVGGIQYLMFSTDEKMAEMAKKTVLFSTIGLFAILASYILVTSISKIIQN